MVRKHEIPYVPLGRVHKRIRASDLKDWIDENTAHGPKDAARLNRRRL